MGNKRNKVLRRICTRKRHKKSKSIGSKLMKLKKREEKLNTSCLGESAMVQHNLSEQGENSNSYDPGEALSQPTTSNDHGTCIYIEPNSATYTDWLTGTTKVIGEPDATVKMQFYPLVAEVPVAEHPSPKTEHVKKTTQASSKKPKEKDSSITKSRSKRLRTEPASNPKQSNDAKEDFTNEFDVFGRFVALQLKSLSEEDAVLAQSEIQEVLIRYRLNKIKARYEMPIENVPSA